MPNKLTLEQRREAFAESQKWSSMRIIICAGTGCIAGGSMKIYDRFREELTKRGLKIAVSLEAEGDHNHGECGGACHAEHSKGEHALVESGCQGFCQMGPLVTLQPQGIMYVKVSVGDVEEIVEKTVIAGEYVDRLLYTRPDSGEPVKKVDNIPFYALQSRLMLGLC